MLDKCSGKIQVSTEIVLIIYIMNISIKLVLINNNQINLCVPTSRINNNNVLTL